MFNHLSREELERLTESILTDKNKLQHEIIKLKNEKQDKFDSLVKELNDVVIRKAD